MWVPPWRGAAPRATVGARSRFFDGRNTCSICCGSTGRVWHSGPRCSSHSLPESRRSLSQADRTSKHVVMARRAQVRSYCQDPEARAAGVVHRLVRRGLLRRPGLWPRLLRGAPPSARTPAGAPRQLVPRRRRGHRALQSAARSVSPIRKGVGSRHEANCSRWPPRRRLLPGRAGAYADRRPPPGPLSLSTRLSARNPHA